MKSLRSPLEILFVSIVTFACAAATAEAIDVGQYVISAKAGEINLASGGVAVRHKGGTVGQPIAAKDHLESGDVIETSADGRLEILLNPGSYLRLAADSEFELSDSSLDHLRIKLVKGSAIIEATGFGGARLETEVDTPQTKIALVQNGLYRIDLQPGATELLVRKGRALVGASRPVKVKRGRKIIVRDPANVEVAKFDKKAQDSLDEWSIERAETLMAANHKLAGPGLGLSIANAMNSGWGYYPWNSRYLGVWIYDPLLSCNTFYPFYSGTSSPYGYGYGGGLGLPSDYYRPPTSGAGRETPPPPPPSNNPPPPSGRKNWPGPSSGGRGELVVHRAPPDREAFRALQERAFRDSYRGREMGSGVDRGSVARSSSSQSAGSGAGYSHSSAGGAYGSGPSSSPAQSAGGRSSESGRGGVAAPIMAK